MSRFEGKVVLITGATSGIGRATAEAFAREGAKVVVAGRREDEGQKTVRLVKDAGGDGLFVRADVKKASEVEAMVRRAVEAFGRLDLAFNNAGQMDEAAGDRVIVDEDEATFDRLMAANVKGVWLCLKYEIAHMLKAGGGAIVNTSSVGGLVGMSSVPVYTATKHAILGLTKAAAVAHAKPGVRINAVCPGAVETEGTAGMLADAKLREVVTGLHPMGRLATPDDVAGAVVWLCSASAAFVTGHALTVDGGYTAL